MLARSISSPALTQLKPKWLHVTTCAAYECEPHRSQAKPRQNLSTALGSPCISHSARRSFITTPASKGIGIRALASLAGHRGIATVQSYIDVNDDMKRAAVELVST